MKKQSRIERFEQIIGAEPVTEFRTNTEFAKYQYFNANGACAKQREFMDTLFDYVRAGVINSGWLLAHDGAFHVEHIRKMATGKRCNRLRVAYHARCLMRDRETTYTALGEVLLGIRDRSCVKIKQDEVTK